MMLQVACLLSPWKVSPSDTLIFVMGVTGSGKSSFVADLLSDSDSDPNIEANIRVRHELESCTASVGFFALDLRPGTRVFLVDTPGFDDTYRSDGEILKEIAFIMAQTYRTGLRLAGIVYLHRITDKRLQGSVARNLRILEHLVGESAFPAVVLATSMWDNVLSGLDGDEATAEERERQLMTSSHGCAQLVAGGSRMMRWTRGDGQSAAAIVKRVIDGAMATADSITLQIQREMVDEERELDETEAGRFVMTDLQRSLSYELSELRDSLRSQIEGLRVGLRSLVAEKQQAYRGTLSRVAVEQQRNQDELTTLQGSQQRLIWEEQSNNEAFHQLQLELGNGRGGLSMEDRDELQLQFDEQQAETKNKRQVVDAQMKKKRKRRLFKKNIVPLLQILAGMGMVAAGGATVNPLLIAPGAGAIVGGITTLRLSIKEKKKQEALEEANGKPNQPIDYPLIDLS